MLKIAICTTPIRPKPTTFPPFGSMAIINSLREIGEDPKFYHIDYFRQNDQDIKKFFYENNFDIVGISSVVSTAYSYTKFLTSIIKKINQNTKIIVGGGLAASAHILLRMASVDYCVIGDGEITIQYLVKAIKNNVDDHDSLMGNIPGIAFLNKHGNLKVTGYGERLTAEKMPMPDYSILNNLGCLDWYIGDDWWIKNYRINIELDPSKKSAIFISAKGCVARCTFCHRFEKGYRVHPLESSIKHLEYLKNMGVKYLSVGDENFGSNKHITKELVKVLNDLGFKWRVSGVRASTIDKDTLKFWADNGCLMVIYGIESGSPAMLKVMEKKITRKQNIDALKWSYEAGLTSPIQLVIGMPGETDKTISETISFLLECMPYYSDSFRNKLLDVVVSINYAQALPGTPLYEYARENGYLGLGDDAEEKYLKKISDTDAYDNDHFINYTNQPLLKVLGWKYWIKWELFRYHAKHNLDINYSTLLPFGIKNLNQFEEINSDDGYFNLRKTSYVICLLLPWNKFTYPFISLLIAVKEARTKWEFIELVFEHIKWSFRFNKKITLHNESLRKIVKIDNDTTQILRLGR